MSKYIDADDVANAIYHHFPSVRTMADARGVIEEAPSIDIVPKRGEWINVSGGWAPNEKCSVCGEVVHEYNYNFCPNCGADMRGKDDGCNGIT